MRCPMPCPRLSSGTAKYQNHDSRGRGYTMVSPSSSSPSRYSANSSGISRTRRSRSFHGIRSSSGNALS